MCGGGVPPPLGYANLAWLPERVGELGEPRHISPECGSGGVVERQWTTQLGGGRPAFWFLVPFLLAGGQWMATEGNRKLYNWKPRVVPGLLLNAVVVRRGHISLGGLGLRPAGRKLLLLSEGAFLTGEGNP